MLNITIDKKYRIPDEWNEIEFQKVLDIAELVENECPEFFQKKLFGKEEEEDKGKTASPEDTMRFIRFQMKYIALLGDIDQEVLQHIEPKDGVDISWLFERCSKFIGMPLVDDVSSNEFIEVEGKRYYRAKEAVDSFGRTTKLENADYGTYSTGMVIMSIIENYKKGNIKVADLRLLTAVMFRPKIRVNPPRWQFWRKPTFKLQPFSEESVEERSNLFKKAKASDVFGAYFFLLKEQQKSLSNLKSSFSDLLQDRTTGKVKTLSDLLLIVRLAMVWLKWRFIGFFLAIRSQS